MEHTKKLEKLSKSGKKLLKCGNLTNFGTIEARPKFLTPNAKTTFNCLWLAFTEAPILQYFDLEYQIWIETDASSYTIDRVLSQQTSKTNLNRVIIKTNLS